MKTSPFVMLTLFAALFLTFSVQAQSEPLKKVESALQAGNARAMADLLDANVELTLPGQDGFFSKAQSEQLLKDFFMNYKAQSFRFMHDGDSGGNSIFGIGTLKTDKGDYRVYVYLKKSGNQYIVQKVKFTND